MITTLMAIKRLAIYPRFLANSVGSIISQIRERAKTIVSTAIDSAAARPITKEFLFMAFSFSKVLYAQLVNLPPYVPICPRGAFWPIAIGAPPPVYTSTFDPATARRENDDRTTQTVRAALDALCLQIPLFDPLECPRCGRIMQLAEIWEPKRGHIWIKRWLETHRMRTAARPALKHRAAVLGSRWAIVPVGGERAGEGGGSGIGGPPGAKAPG